LKHKVKIDSDARYYHPFTLLFFTLSLGLATFYFGYLKIDFFEWVIPHYKNILIFTVIVELILFRIVFPKESILFDISHTGVLFSYKKDKEFYNKMKVHEITYWWNYKFDGGGDKGNPEIDVNSDRSGIKGNGTSNSHWIYIKLIGSNGRCILLYEAMENWVEYPDWDYSIDDKDKYTENYRCIGLHRLLKALKKEHVKTIRSV